jgi:hypothetical protein
MNKVIGLIMLCIVCAILRAAVVALVLALTLFLLVSFIRRPYETLLFLASLGGLALVNSRPLACACAVGVIGVAVVVAGAIQKSRRPPLLTDGREHR